MPDGELDYDTEVIEQYLEWLAPRQRDDYRACEIEGLSQEEQAEERGVDPATISMNVQGAKRRLRSILEEKES